LEGERKHQEGERGRLPGALHAQERKKGDGLFNPGTPPRKRHTGMPKRQKGKTRPCVNGRKDEAGVAFLRALGKLKSNSRGKVGP